MILFLFYLEQETKLQVFRSSGISIGLSDFAKIKKMKDEGQNVVIVKCSAQWFCLDKHKLKERLHIYKKKSTKIGNFFSLESSMKLINQIPLYFYFE